MRQEEGKGRKRKHQHQKNRKPHETKLKGKTTNANKTQSQNTRRRGPRNRFRGFLRRKQKKERLIVVECSGASCPRNSWSKRSSKRRAATPRRQQKQMQRTDQRTADLAGACQPTGLAIRREHRLGLAQEQGHGAKQLKGSEREPRKLRAAGARRPSWQQNGKSMSHGKQTL